MSAADFAGFVALPVVIDSPGRYLTRSGEAIEIKHASLRHDFGCRGRYTTGQTDKWHKSGRLYFSILSDNDIVAKAP